MESFFLLRLKCTHNYYRLDLYDDPSRECVIATFELPGVTRNDFTMNVVDGKFVLAGERPLRVRPLSAQHAEWTYSEPLKASDAVPGLVSGFERQSRCDSKGSVGENPRVPSVPVSELRYGRFKREIQLPIGVEVGGFRERTRLWLLIIFFSGRFVLAQARHHELDGWHIGS